MQNPKPPLKITNSMTLDQLARIFEKQNYKLHYSRFRKQYVFYEERDLVYLRVDKTTHFPVIGLCRGYRDDIEEIRPTHFNKGYINYQGSLK